MAGLYANLKKCKFHMDTVEYLRFILSPKGLQMDPAKVSAILDWPKPQKVQDVQAFLGFTNFYRRFIHNYSESGHVCCFCKWHQTCKHGQILWRLCSSAKATCLGSHIHSIIISIMCSFTIKC